MQDTGKDSRLLLLDARSPVPSTKPCFQRKVVLARREFQRWTDDAELRGVASLAIRLMDGLEGRCPSSSNPNKENFDGTLEDDSSSCSCSRGAHQVTAAHGSMFTNRNMSEPCAFVQCLRDRASFL